MMLTIACPHIIRVRELDVGCLKGEISVQNLERPSNFDDGYRSASTILSLDCKQSLSSNAA